MKVYLTVKENKNGEEYYVGSNWIEPAILLDNNVQIFAKFETSKSSNKKMLVLDIKRKTDGEK